MTFEEWLDTKIALTPKQAELLDLPEVLDMLEQTWQAAQCVKEDE